jgi:hypothetical protein
MVTASDMDKLVSTLQRGRARAGAEWGRRACNRITEWNYVIVKFTKQPA